ncbi:MAG: WecB/TagA/CpsF family glycosyltransferase [Candidatus Eremiobacter antarcticus]|nr:WecB/TagA/CpsF family glycosyltransferase [Candidatus Eremiobacteraeota bacterium]MBC5809080.1 WecB/TagA/CpsF family glycosyltransferase [Candidatus Eremiobacteraeota bacterium]
MERALPQLQVLGSRVHGVDMTQACARIEALVDEQRFAHVVTFGSEMAMLARRDGAYRDVINGADLVVPDSIGLVSAMRVLGRPECERVAGIDLVADLCAMCARRGFGIYLLGGAPSVAAAAADELLKRYPGLQVAGVRDGYFPSSDDADVADGVRRSGAQLLFVALGFPKQEFWIRGNAVRLGAMVCMGVGGSFDVIAGRLKRAPALARRLGLEWLYRLAREPRRWRRQLALPQFAALVAAQALRERRNHQRARDATRSIRR